MSNLFINADLKDNFTGKNGLELSIEKWEKIVKHWNEVNWLYFSTSTCGLCEQYQDNCRGCPLSEAGHGCDENDSLYQKIVNNVKKPKGKRLAKQLLEILKGLEEGK